jgi:hypothetical protein
MMAQRTDESSAVTMTLRLLFPPGHLSDLEQWIRLIATPTDGLFIHWRPHFATLTGFVPIGCGSPLGGQ